MVEGLPDVGLPRLVDLMMFPGDGPVAGALETASVRGGWATLVREELPGVVTHRASVSDSLPMVDGSAPDLSLPYLSGRARRLYARVIRELNAAAGPVSAAEVGADPNAISAFVDLQAQGWKGDAARGGNGYRRVGLEEWLVAFTDRWREQGRLRVTTLHAGDSLVHSGIAVRLSDRIFGIADAFDERFAALGPGAVGRILAMKSALGEPGVELFDPSMATHYTSSHSARIYPDRRMRTRQLVGTSPVSRAIVRTVPRLQRLRERPSPRSARRE